jgi:hypothetical protein
MPFSDTLNLFWIIILATIIIFIYVAVITNQKRFPKFRVKCSKCGHTWKPYELGVLIPFFNLTNLLRYLWIKEKWFVKCPQCRKFSWCQIIEETKKLD